MNVTIKAQELLYELKGLVVRLEYLSTSDCEDAHSAAAALSKIAVAKLDDLHAMLWPSQTAEVGQAEAPHLCACEAMRKLQERGLT